MWRHGPARTVHFHEQLVQRVFPLVVAAAEPSPAPRPADCVNLVNENDARRLFAGLLEQVTDLPIGSKK
jgi:hypothetical protein